jgi:hypothetical protein
MQAIALCIMKAWPDSVHVRRKRGKKWAWSNGGTEKEKGKASAIKEEKVEALIALSIFAQGRVAKDRTAWIEFAMPIPIQWMAKADLGRQKLHSVRIEKGVLIAQTHRVYAGKNIETIEGPPPVELIAESMTKLFLRGSWERPHREEARNRYRIHALATLLRNQKSIPSFEDFIHNQFVEFELEAAEDIQLLTGSDLYAPLEELLMRDRIKKEFPALFSIGDATYRLEYDVPHKNLMLIQTHGLRKTPPPLSMCPKKNGWKMFWVHKKRTFRLK